MPFALRQPRARPRASPRPSRVRRNTTCPARSMCAAMFGLVIGGAESAVHGDSPVVSAAIVLAGVLRRLPLRPPRDRRARADPAGRPARPAGAGAVGGRRLHRLHRLDDAADLDPVPPPRDRLHRGGDRRGDHAVAADQHDRRPARGLSVGSHPGRAARRHRHGDLGHRARPDRDHARRPELVRHRVADGAVRLGLRHLPAAQRAADGRQRPHASAPPRRAGWSRPCA